MDVFSYATYAGLWNTYQLGLAIDRLKAKSIDRLRAHGSNMKFSTHERLDRVPAVYTKDVECELRGSSEVYYLKGNEREYMDKFVQLNYEPYTDLINLYKSDKRPQHEKGKLRDWKGTPGNPLSSQQEMMKYGPEVYGTKYSAATIGGLRFRSSERQEKGKYEADLSGCAVVSEQYNICVYFPPFFHIQSALIPNSSTIIPFVPYRFTWTETTKKIGTMGR